MTMSKPNLADREAADRILRWNAGGQKPPHEKVAGLPGTAQCKHILYILDRVAAGDSHPLGYGETPYRHHVYTAKFAGQLCQCGKSESSIVHIKAGASCA